MGECRHFWRGANGLCIECGVQPGINHEHRFNPGNKTTMQNCIDCGTVVLVKPDIPAPEPLTLPNLLLAINGWHPVSFMKIISRVDNWHKYPPIEIESSRQ